MSLDYTLLSILKICGGQ